MEPRRLAIYCDLSGQIKQLIRDDLKIQGIALEGITLPALIASDSRSACFEFLAAVRDESAVYGWTLNVRTEKRGTIALHFAGVAVEGRLLILACDQVRGLLDYTNQLMQGNQQQLNDLRELMICHGMPEPSSADVLSQITELTNETTALQRELAKKNEELAQLVGEKNELIGFAAHDLRNPLAGITLCSSMLAERDDLPDDCRQVAELMKVECVRMSSLVDDYLSVSAIQSGRLHLSRSKTDLAELVREVVGKNELLHADLRFVFHPLQDALVATVDRMKIGQVLYNLLENAARHTSKDSNIDVALTIDDTMAVISIEDDGPGIRREDWSLVLKSFQQGFHNVIQQGWGLGLAICHRIATAHGGEIRLSASPNQGAKIELRIPLDEECGTAQSNNLSCVS